jgi:hypothetical protein
MSLSLITRVSIFQNGVHICPYLQKMDTVKLLIRQRIVQEVDQINCINEFNIFPSVHSACNLCLPTYANKLYKILSYPVYNTFLHRIHQYVRVTGIWTFWIEKWDFLHMYLRTL